MKNITDLEVVNELLNDEQYNNEMYQFHTRLDSLKKDDGREEIISGLIKENYDRIEFYIDKKKKESYCAEEGRVHSNKGILDRNEEDNSFLT